jgi:hypothetical protein
VEAFGCNSEAAYLIEDVNFADATARERHIEPRFLLCHWCNSLMLKIEFSSKCLIAGGDMSASA